jgi:hypothetical protein
VRPDIACRDTHVSATRCVSVRCVSVSIFGFSRCDSITGISRC